jgi:hypothetical protein
MKVAVINVSGNVGKTTVARHLLMPRLPGAEFIAVETLNASEGEARAMRGRQFGALLDYLHALDNAVIDIGASNVEELLNLMRLYRDSQEDFDCFVVPTTPPVKQQQDTVATLVDLAKLGVPPARMKLVFNMAEFGTPIAETFYLVFNFLAQHRICEADPACCIGTNDIFGRMRQMDPVPTIAALMTDKTDYKALIAAASSTEDKLNLGYKLSTLRLARNVSEELDACFAALRLGEAAPAAARPHSRKAAA